MGCLYKKRDGIKNGTERFHPTPFPREAVYMRSGMGRDDLYPTFKKKISVRKPKQENKPVK